MGAGQLLLYKRLRRQGPGKEGVFEVSKEGQEGWCVLKKDNKDRKWEADMGSSRSREPLEGLMRVEGVMLLEPCFRNITPGFSMYQGIRGRQKERLHTLLIWIQVRNGGRHCQTLWAIRETGRFQMCFGCKRHERLTDSMWKRGENEGMTPSCLVKWKDLLPQEDSSTESDVNARSLLPCASSNSLQHLCCLALGMGLSLAL